MSPQEFAYKFLRALFVPKHRFFALVRCGFYSSMPDNEYLKLAYKYCMGKELDLENPQTFTEKLNWLKLNDHRPEYTIMADKYAVKKFVSDKIGEEYVIPLLGVYDSFSEIDFDSLPNQFVLKCNHDSGGGMSICRDKSKFDKETAERKITASLKRTYGTRTKEWVYANIPHKIIAEQYMQDGDNPNLPVYKFFTFNGEPKLIQAIQDDKTKYETIDYFDTEWKKLNLRQNYPNSKVPYEKPECLDEMLRIAAKLSTGIPHVRVDLYQINGKVYFSEFTFYSDAGLTGFDPPEWDETLGSWLELPEKHC